ncbi:MAG TPA: hypothetical protein VH597_02630 [Verrucomicrobiae bacterium]|jgi:hypothetical protein|nr:hypothetical protein [Verrucomicrobiae bacterium]
MRKLLQISFRLWVLFLCAAAFGQMARAQDFNVTTPGGQFAFLINGMDNNPMITLVRGHTYTFAIDTTASFHPFFIGTAVFGPAAPGVTGNNVTSGTVTFAVPIDAADCVYYCSIHGFFGQIHMIDSAPPPPPPPPAMTIVGLSVTDNVLLTVQQSSTNGFTFVPQASTNLATTNWFALTVQSNHFENGTNEIWCGKPPGDSVFFRVQAQ